ncbi:GNAT family N-acetyltransferase [Priestia filamentosa]|uniref:GNAT family N-acetyltransferase n=1 Tax=Priestia filamentosa TaxID=1402861 RepID=UPI000A08DF80|nr:GNAT family N-acetyltransferase [Priestia filamentosa]MDT3762196.1 GNAT family N-acetyltransferase [Priestia filamentosa]WRU96688.1 GNAT family N-acetyltransferase [Priestia filamentosa]SMF61981.1 Predicted acetyltransferase, GNAT superfamily [Priestia filamentosa]
MMNTQEIEIRSLHTIQELEDVKKLESNIWGEHDSTPTHQTVTVVKNGGIMLGAYCNGKLVGFQYSFPGFNGQSVYLCSHMLGIDKTFRNNGIGEKLKQAQRKEAIKLGYSHITWTYDPLESINAYLNITKLGGTCTTYMENCYGEMDDLLNNGIPSDRFLVEWPVLQRKEKSHQWKETDIEFVQEKSLIQWKVDEKGLPIPSFSLPLPEQEYTKAFIAIPKDFKALKEGNMEAARKWRLVTREIFSKLMKQGWQVTDFIRNSEEEMSVQFYVFSKK